MTRVLIYDWENVSSPVKNKLHSMMLKRGNSRVKEALQWVISHFLSLVYSTGRDKKILI